MTAEIYELAPHINLSKLKAQYDDLDYQIKRLKYALVHFHEPCKSLLEMGATPEEITEALEEVLIVLGAKPENQDEPAA